MAIASRETRDYVLAMTSASIFSSSRPHAATAAAAVAHEHRAVRFWLYGVAALILAMVLVGGATRLTDSGLSITEWKPLLGAIPPLNNADWQDAFRKYQQIPEYRVQNRGMSLTEFKLIYWWEWAHRFLGRAIGLAFLLPFLVFWARGMLPKSFLPRLAGIFVLGGLQGALGWYMVMSGLTERTDVSQYRLAAHLGLAVLIFGAVLWTAFDLRRADAAPAGRGTALLSGTAGLVAGAVFLQIILGAFVAGTDAGLSHRSWPLIDGAIIPDGLGAMQPWWRNIFENVLTIQFNHRMLGYAIALLAAAQMAIVWRASVSGLRLSAELLLAVVFVQIALGVATLLSGVEIALALAHQGVAVLLFALALWHWHRARQV